MFRADIVTDIAPIPAAELIGHLRPVERYTVTLLDTEERGNVVLKHYLICAAQFKGCDVGVSLRLAIFDQDSSEVLLSVPGGGGAFGDEALWWLAATYKSNQAAIDWIGRGRSPRHDHISAPYDPLFMNGDSFRDSFMFHNLSAVWACLNWLFHAGYRPTKVAGGSWGGVYSLLLAALDSRVERIFPTFGCGGISFAGVEKRSLWDAALEHIGPQRQREWTAAFDPLLRISDIGATVYYETATNDKFFSLQAAMASWHRVKHPLFLSLLPNQDHSMWPFARQPYDVAHLPDDPAIARCRDTSAKHLEWDAGSGTVQCSPVTAEESAQIQLIWSEQLASHGDMSREWTTLRPIACENDRAVFQLAPTNPDANLLFFASRLVENEAGRTMNASTPIHAAQIEQPLRSDRSTAVLKSLLDARTEELWSAPVGDRNNAPVEAMPDGWLVRFSAQKGARVTRFGVRPWLLPPDWRAIEVVLAEPVDGAAARLDLFISRRYQHFDEEALRQTFAEAESHGDGKTRVYRFPREGFVPAIVVGERFRGYDLPRIEAVIDDFDAVGLIDRAGLVSASVTVIALRLA